ncbi:hypothetical protein BDY21DRAFT_337235 [Lineolata rhizophorae]|uniref:C2H2-type domain-containing protein n=1 Tax=Lineolata rhizophorae TaxID=578093 RepID=A0A6A6P9A1_9PEZI|nr:hypothetical protein BDY21DRAFT_337235 [Lineolata rhizophorae]
MRATRDKEAAGQPLGEDDYHRDERIVIRGGISHDGTPAELVRERNDGKVIPLANRDEVPAVQFKRPLSDEEDFDDGGVRRSMARRRKSDKPSDVMHTCRECKKEFKRPCDLTKHEKTHSRPWKCPQPKCRYHELGWPTEKERDRHINDKHSSAPPQYKCQYPPCTYSSKRESNCKQHMEKSHGFNYVRSKSNGRTKKTTSSAGETPATATPLTPFMATPPSALQNMPTPVSPFTTSPQLQNFNTFDPPPAPVYGLTPAMSTMGDVSGDNRRESVATSGSSMSYSTNQSPAELNTFAPTFTPEEPTLDAGSSMFNGFMQPQTPGLNTANNGYQLNSNFNNAFSQSPSMPLSAEAQNMTLFTPQADDDTLQIDESFAGHFPPVGDFTLFDSSDPSSDLGGNQDWYNSLGNTNSMDGQFDSLFNQGGNQFSEFF